MESLPKDKTTHAPAGRQWVVFRSEKFWHDAALWAVVVFAGAAGAAAIGLTYLMGDADSVASRYMRRHQKARPVAEVPETPQPPAARRAVDGMPMAEGEVEGPYFAATIDNMLDARPASGVARSPLVIEAPVEGGITRLLAFFPAQMDVKKIGPVRSVRPYYIDWAQEFDALFAHVGGSPEALEKMKSSDVRDLNQFFNGGTFWRGVDRSAPHNVYTSVKLLAKAADPRYQAKKAKPLAPWKFKEQEASDKPAQAPDLVIEYSAPAYRVAWKYDPKHNDYARFQGGVTQRDDDGTPVRAKNIVVQYTKVSVIDDIGRRRITTIGKGAAVVVLDGKAIKGTWSKKGPDSRTRFFDAHDEEIAFNAGTTWVEVVSDNAVVTY